MFDRMQTAHITESAESKLSAYQLGIFVLCGVCLVIDGFDVQAMGYVAPAIIQDWKLGNAQMAPVFSAGLVGVLIGAFLCAMLADRFGRRPVLIGATLFFAALTLLTAQASGVAELRWIRLIAGIGLGGIMPNAIALCGEFSPKSSRVLVMMLVGNGFTAGAALGGFIAAWLIPRYGWQSVFYFGGVVPLIIAILMLFKLPESPQFLALKGRHAIPTVNVPLTQLFQDGRAQGTALLWTANFMNLLNLYFLSSWLPTVVRDAGYSNVTGVYVGTSLQLGGTLGSILLGSLVNRYGFTIVLAPCFLLAALNIALIGMPWLSLGVLFVVVFVAGTGVMGGQVGLNALAATYYPTELRSTGIGAGLGVGRLGAIVGPLIGGQLMAWRWNTRALFLAASVPALISALVILVAHTEQREKEQRIIVR